MKGSCRVVIGYDEGTIMIKIGQEEPVVSMDNSGKIIWAKHNEIQTVNIKTVGADFEVIDGERLPLAVKELGSCDLYPQVSELCSKYFYRPCGYPKQLLKWKFFFFKL
ncbi:coatomer subunit beta'-1-like [Magnolia sinica]|uniref:coatomer subunit beta'-1-like n=1 Tax=Magnolia sinica TaxID=86752 RepID=UPI002658134C|nr:coatomer subunit beta'-1-like [Magnolia sinica]